MKPRHVPTIDRRYWTAITLLMYKRSIAISVYGYWLVIAVARTTGTAIGDWIAENKIFKLGLPLTTLLTGLAFLSVVLMWRNRAQRNPATI